ncbi:hypothetical protein B620_gp07 [Croceibacter phage P2559S]|uniref:hypothetical protein n=1 Tax=Croceibacter phage P2559S TaxID=1176422 RepID=UPI0002688E6C|nr:hypothetical protein B620_gp07 [Croceibacter phage P2559S]AFM54785.1 hypothetical protein P2559S_07 [Croceibacter phage P2559S]
MATETRVRRLKAQVHRLHGTKEMRAEQAKGEATEKALQAYYDAYDKFDDALSDYYAAKLMLMKVKNPDIFEMYLGLTKQAAKSKMLRQITRLKNSNLSNQLNVNRINKLKEAIKNNKNKAQKAKLRKVLGRLESWAKDLNYEERQGKTYYKAQG